MHTETKFEQLFSTLIRETTEGRLIWKVMGKPSQLVEASNSIVNLAFCSNYKDKNIAVFEERVQHYDGSEDIWYWGKEVKFAILGENNSILFETSDPPSQIYQLFSAIREQVSGVNDLLNELI